MFFFFCLVCDFKCAAILCFAEAGKGGGREKPQSKNSFVTVDVDLALSAHSNAELLYALKKKSADKQVKLFLKLRYVFYLLWI